MERLEHIPRQINAEITRIGCQIHLHRGSILSWNVTLFLFVFIIKNKDNEIPIIDFFLNI
jgi:hypothetical protein